MAATEAVVHYAGNDFFIGRGVVGDGQDSEGDAVAFFRLSEHPEHGAIVLLGHDGFVALLPGIPADDEIEGFCRIAGDDEVGGVAACEGG